MARLDESSTLLILADGLAALLVPPALLALGIGLRQRSRALTLLSAATASVLSGRPSARSACPTGRRHRRGRRRRCGCSTPTSMPPTRTSRRSRRRSGPPPRPRRPTQVDHDAAAGLLRSGVLARFPYRVTEIRNGPPGIALWSRFPLTDPEVLDTGGMPRIRATVLLGARRLRFYNVHVVAPVGGPRSVEGRAPPGRGGAPARAWTAGGRRRLQRHRHHPSFRRSCGTGWRTPTSARAGMGGDLAAGPMALPP